MNTNGEKLADFIWNELGRHTENQHPIVNMTWYEIAGFATFEQWQRWWKKNCPIKL